MNGLYANLYRPVTHTHTQHACIGTNEGKIRDADGADTDIHLSACVHGRMLHHDGHAAEGVGAAHADESSRDDLNAHVEGNGGWWNE
jgi:hypothetical protein